MVDADALLLAGAGTCASDETRSSTVFPTVIARRITSLVVAPGVPLSNPNRRLVATWSKETFRKSPKIKKWHNLRSNLDLLQRRVQSEKQWHCRCSREHHGFVPNQWSRCLPVGPSRCSPKKHVTSVVLTSTDQNAFLRTLPEWSTRPLPRHKSDSCCRRHDTTQTFQSWRHHVTRWCCLRHKNIPVTQTTGQTKTYTKFW